MVEYGIYALGSVLAIYGASYLILGVTKPHIFLDFFSITESERRKSQDWKLYLKMGLTVLGLGVLFYHAAAALVMFIPADWGALNQDGDWEYTRHGLQITFAGYASLILAFELEKRAEESVKWKALSRKMRLFEDEIWHSSDAASVRRLLDSAKREFRDELEFSSSSYENRLCRSVAEGIRLSGEDRIKRLNDR